MMMMMMMISDDDGLVMLIDITDVFQDSMSMI